MFFLPNFNVCLPHLPLPIKLEARVMGRFRKNQQDSFLDFVKMFESCLVDYPPQEICFDSLKTSKGREVKSEMNVQTWGRDLCLQSPGSPGLSLPGFVLSLLQKNHSWKGTESFHQHATHTPPPVYKCKTRGPHWEGPAQGDKARVDVQAVAQGPWL